VEEETDKPREVIETRLAHVAENRVEVPYTRSNQFEQRRFLVGDWARYLDQGPGDTTMSSLAARCGS